jgi:hypothetical protein
MIYLDKLLHLGKKRKILKGHFRRAYLGFAEKVSNIKLSLSSIG